MINLRNSPFLWLSCLLILSVSVENLVYGVSGPWLYGWGLSIFALSACWAWRRFNPGNQLWSTLAIFLMVFTAGLVRQREFSRQHFPDAPLTDQIRISAVLEVSEVLKSKPTGITIRGRMVFMMADSSGKSTTDRFLVLYIRQPIRSDYIPGDFISVKGLLSAIPGPLNPHAFDIRSYYRTIGIRHQLKANGKDIQSLAITGRSVMRMTAKWQSSLCTIVRQNTSAPVAQLTNALVWGERTNMDDDIRKAFADSGAMHVLSVSGMHMAMIYSMLYLLLGPPGAGSFLRRNIRLAMYGIAIVLYMGLTGACPAVVRSGLMILLYLLGKAMGWNTQIWNLLGFAAFLMVWFNPFVIDNIGFQLSFLAMAGILLYAQPMIRFLSFRLVIAQRIWEITAVSLAAQVFILPLLLYHFYQFPLTFIASSLVAMPASYIIIFGSLLNICLSPLDPTWLWSVYDTVAIWFIQSMKWMAGLNPTMNYSLPNAALWSLSAMAILFSASLMYGWRLCKIVAWMMATCALITLVVHRVDVWQTKEIMVYHHYTGLLMDVFSNGQCFTLSDSACSSESIVYAARGHRVNMDVIAITPLKEEVPFQTITWTFDPPILYWGNTKILLWTGMTSEEKDLSDITHVIIRQTNDLWQLAQYLEKQPAVQVIIPAHCRGYPLRKIKTIIERTGNPWYEIQSKGAYTLRL